MNGDDYECTEEKQKKTKDLTFSRMIMLTAAAKPNKIPMMNMMAAAALAPTEPLPNMPRLFSIPLDQQNTFNNMKQY